MILAAAIALRRPPLAVESARVDRGPLLVSVDAEGKTRVRERYVVSAPVSGLLQRIALVEGDRVARGAQVAQIDPLAHTSAVAEAAAQLREWQAQRSGVATLRVKPESQEQARLRVESAIVAAARARAQSAGARAAFDQARRDAARYQRLAAEGAVARRELEQAQLRERTAAEEQAAALLQTRIADSELAIARAASAELRTKNRDPDYLEHVYDARIAAVQAQLDNLRAEAARTAVRAPASGVVLRLLTKSAQYVSAGTPLLELGDPRQLEVVIDVLSQDAAQIAPGDAMAIDAGAAGATLTARVRVVKPSAFTKTSALGVEEQRVNVIGDFDHADAGLGDGYRVEAKIVVWQRRAALRVPVGALFRCGERWCVYAVERARARRRTVTIGRRNDEFAEVRGGLHDGERVILHPADRVGEGARVDAREPAVTPEAR
ncbi:efflux RND transporter periplasmic adaptor subunit [bacterium]|nr:MAG: efflux RND transporter periplasmic adaptor subunit [bacterium]